MALGLLLNRQDPASNPTTTRDAYPHGNSFGLFCCSRADPICDRLPPIATQGLHKGYWGCPTLTDRAGGSVRLLG